MPRTSSVLIPVSFGQTDGTDSKNCSVRALSNCTDMPITEAKNLLAKHGRKPHRGALHSTFSAAYKEAGLDFVGFFGKTKAAWLHARENAYEEKPFHAGMQLDTFCKVFNKGSFVVVVNGHATCVRGGKIIDNGNLQGGMSVLCAWKKPSVSKG